MTGLSEKKLSYFSGILEEWIKNTLINSLTLNYTSNVYAKAELYLDLNIYNTQSNGKDCLASFAETINNSKETFIKHHHKDRNGCIPIWVLIEEITFGQVDTFISQLNLEYKNQWIDMVFGKEYRKFVQSWISVARYIRNTAAHYSRFYGKTFVVVPSLPKEDLKQFGIRNNNKNNLFVMLFTEKKLLSFFPDDLKKLEWNTFIEQLEEIVLENKTLIDLKRNGFRENWKESLML